MVAYHPSQPEVKKDVPPTEEDGYIAPKNGPYKDYAPGSQKQGWVDSKGNYWVPAPTGSGSDHGGGHWDVYGPRGNNYVNRYPGGKERGGVGKKPNLPRIEAQPALTGSIIFALGIGMATVLFGSIRPQYEIIS
jgi:hypothetical protein